ncbi:probable E3 ubiquitin-protein ligase RNF217 [Limulus polyphemus]|uniref:RBR-type E3 ubiquitin transferase n=1 Tax=Limulus polyphemus TaxID=6850 RepID=A0ABM1SFL4_LIMPO|nr:probable E3 ubiquitin-protein ligase RNF217 [Limulus polyphemus]XP_022242419.1 probable E3 ubiquitin-protein ligase RNF217 [Limulus polyphemus]
MTTVTELSIDVKDRELYEWNFEKEKVDGSNSLGSAIHVSGHTLDSLASHINRTTSMDEGDDQESPENYSPLDMGNLKFLLECFFLSFGPEFPQLGRNHPRSNPEYFETSFSGEFESEISSSSSRSSQISVDLDPVFFRQPGVFAPRHGTHTQIVNDDDVAMETLVPFGDNVLLRELSEMRVILERILDTREQWNNDHEILDILEFLESHSSHSDPTAHFPVGELDCVECGICLEVHWLYRRPCCNYSACNNCLHLYFTTKVEEGFVKIQCCNYSCYNFVHRDEISARLTSSTKEIFNKLLVRANEDDYTKTCPRCSHVMKLNSSEQRKLWANVRKVKCPECQLDWCFSCHAPWHVDLTCKEYMKGDRLVKSWARKTTHGQFNAQRCPKCKIYIQRSSGCDHMHCSRCKTDFCYRCGERFRGLKFFGDHYSKLSVFGCKYRYKLDKPVERKLVRGAIFGGKLMVAPVLGSFALCAGAMAVSVGVFALPFYSGVKLYQHYQAKKRLTITGTQHQSSVGQGHIAWELDGV